jgi:hypothetical protein
LACIHSRRGELLGLESPRLAEAEHECERAAQLLEKLVGVHNAVPHYREELATTLAARATVRARLGSSRLSDALRDCEAAQTHLEALIEEQRRKGIRTNPHYLSLLSRTLSIASGIHSSLGNSANGQKNLAKAVNFMKQAVEIDPARARDRACLERLTSQHGSSISQ